MFKGNYRKGINMKEIEQQMARLNDVRSKADEHAASKQRLTGELDGYEKTYKASQSECREKFDAGVDQLPDIILELRKEAEESIQKAEKILSSKAGFNP